MADALCGAEIHMFCLLTARDRNEIPKIVVNSCRFDGIRLRGHNLRGSSFRRCTFYGASLEDIWAEDSEFIECNFNRADLYNAKLCRSNLRGSHFRQANVFYADFSDAKCENTTWHLAQIGHTKFKNVKFDGATKSPVIPDELITAVKQINDAGFAVVPGDQSAHDGPESFTLDGDGVTQEDNYHSEKYSDPV
jgi:uncharacterized protein YjbI with pentapeptide repeats